MGRVSADDVPCSAAHMDSTAEGGGAIRVAHLRWAPGVSDAASVPTTAGTQHATRGTSGTRATSASGTRTTSAGSTAGSTAREPGVLSTAKSLEQVVASVQQQEHPGETLDHFDLSLKTPCCGLRPLGGPLNEIIRCLI